MSHRRNPTLLLRPRRDRGTISIAPGPGRRTFGSQPSSRLRAPSVDWPPFPCWAWRAKQDSVCLSLSAFVSACALGDLYESVTMITS